MKVFHVRRRFWLILTAVSCFFLISSALGERGFIRLNRMIRQRDELQVKVRELHESNSKLAGEVQKLRDDPDTIENLARTELGMVRNGETVYILTDRSGEQPQ